jgi:hypothetical protein
MVLVVELVEASTLSALSGPLIREAIGCWSSVKHWMKVIHEAIGSRSTALADVVIHSHLIREAIGCEPTE